MIEYTDEDLQRFAPNDATLDKLFAAQERGDEDAVMALRREMIYPAESLLTLKVVLGAARVREMGLNMSEAERKFGKDWLERDNEELRKILWS